MKTLMVVSNRAPRAVARGPGRAADAVLQPAGIRSAARTGGGDAAAAVRARRGDVRSIDRGSHGLRRHAHRHHQSRDRRRGGRAAARDSRRRQEGRDGQPDRLGCRRAPPATTSSSSRHHDARAAPADALPGRGHRGQRQRRGHHSVGPGVEHDRDAAGRRDRDRVVRQERRSSTCCRSPAAARASR